MKYFRIEELLMMIDDTWRVPCQRIYVENKELFSHSPGSTHNHQAWPGGYIDHIVETMNIAVVLYHSMNGLRELPFSLSDALLVLFIHDLEKPWGYSQDKNDILASKEYRHVFRKEKLTEYSIKLTQQQEDAFKYVEGEIDGTYTPGKRTMNELAAFCHMCDIASARIWHNSPKETKDSWGQRNY